MYKKFFKRFFDVFLCSIALIPLSPFFLLFALLIKLDSPGPVIFRQERLGRDGRVFSIYKFRSMCVGAEQKGTGQYSMKNDPRITRIGRFLRATSMDELPQLINVLKGEMSLIGFRPPLTYHPWPFSEYSEEQKKMFLLRPGLTGWAQIHGRKTVLWEDRIRLNIWYAEHVSFPVDLKIFFITIAHIFLNKDNGNTAVTVQPAQAGEKIPQK